MMFEAAELGRKVSKEDFEAMAPDLRIELLTLQQQIRAAGFPVIIVFAGVDGGGKSETVNLLNQWMDPRWIVTRAYDRPSDEERERPRYWRYWRDLPAKGHIGLFLSSWYHQPLMDNAFGRTSSSEFDEEMMRAIRFEKELADDGALIIKFWMHLSQKAQKKRLRKLESDPLTAWRVTASDWEHYEMYDRFVASAEQLIRQTSRGHALWHIVEGTDHRYRSAVVLNTVKEAVTRHLEVMTALKKAGDSLKKGGEHTRSVPEILRKQPSVLSAMDMSVTLPEDEAQVRMAEQKSRLALLHRQAVERGISSILVFEGWDAAGKGGSIRRITSTLNAKDYRVVQTAAPTEEEHRYHYLWRFWRQLSRAGRTTIFDRSWYGRVLVERVEGFCSEEAWKRAYGEINDFEQQLVEHGTVVVKFWLNITQEEQLQRFERRETIDYKRWKLTDEDWRNREKWPLYESAVNDMIEKTSTRYAPWTLVAANDKPYARLKVLESFCNALETRLASGTESPSP